MDSMLVNLRELKSELNLNGSLRQLGRSALVVDFCKKKQVIVRISPDDLTPEDRQRYTRYLVELTKAFLSLHPEIRTWSDFSRRPDTRKVHKLLFEYGIRAEVFPDIEAPVRTEGKERSPTSITLPELYEVCQIKFHFQGSFLSFKKVIQRQYGSFAEYCITKGYDINTTKWESDETALRVAHKLGSIEEIQRRSKSLYKYLVDHNLLEVVFSKKTA